MTQNEFPIAYCQEGLCQAAPLPGAQLLFRESQMGEPARKGKRSGSLNRFPVFKSPGGVLSGEARICSSQKGP